MQRVIILVFILLLPGLPLWAQSPTATIDGRVLDPAKAVIQGATIKAINLDTNVQYATQTNSAGLFTIVNLPPGSYRLEVSKAGFRSIVNPGVVLHVQDVVALNFDLPVGSILESITVTSGAPVVNTEDASVSTVVDRNFAENLPMNGRSAKLPKKIATAVHNTMPRWLILAQRGDPLLAGGIGERLCGREITALEMQASEVIQGSGDFGRVVAEHLALERERIAQDPLRRVVVAAIECITDPAWAYHGPSTTTLLKLGPGSSWATNATPCCSRWRPRLI